MMQVACSQSVPEVDVFLLQVLWPHAEPRRSTSWLGTTARESYCVQQARMPRHHRHQTLGPQSDLQGDQQSDSVDDPSKQALPAEQRREARNMRHDSTGTRAGLASQPACVTATAAGQAMQRPRTRHTPALIPRSD